MTKEKERDYVNVDFLQRGFRKPVPTDMDWSPCYAGHYVEVKLIPCGRAAQVVIWGAISTTAGRFFENIDDAIDFYNSLTYIQSDKDLAGFKQDSFDNSNGWPSDRPLIDEWDWEEPIYTHCRGDNRPDDYEEPYHWEI